MSLLFGVPALAGPGRLKPERWSRKRGPRPSRSLCSASRRTAGAADSTHRLVRPDECSRLVGGTPTRAVETTALPIFNCIAPPEGGTPYRWHDPDGFMVSMLAKKRKGALHEPSYLRPLPRRERSSELLSVPLLGGVRVGSSSSIHGRKGE